MKSPDASLANSPKAAISPPSKISTELLILNANLYLSLEGLSPVQIKLLREFIDTIR